MALAPGVLRDAVISLTLSAEAALAVADEAALMMKQLQCLHKSELVVSADTHGLGFWAPHTLLVNQR